MPSAMRIHGVRTYYEILRSLVRSGPVAAARPRLIGKQFAERMMLAVTQVNGCRYCSYLHTRMALRSGVEAEEARALLAGELEAAPADEHTAIIFAQHMADGDGVAAPDSFRRLLDEYGPKKTHEIVASIRAILVGNIYGIAFDGLWFRLRLRPLQGSGFGRELAIVVGSALWGPLVVLSAAVLRLFRRRRPTLEEVRALDGPPAGGGGKALE